MDAPPTPPAAPEPALQTAARLLAEGRLGDAVARLGALVAEAPAYAAAHVLHATALEAAGRHADALEAWGHAALLVPNSPLVRRERGRLAALVAAPPTEPVDAVLPGARPTDEVASPATGAMGPTPDVGDADVAPPTGDASADDDRLTPVDAPPAEDAATPPMDEPDLAVELVEDADADVAPPEDDVASFDVDGSTRGHEPARIVDPAPPVEAEPLDTDLFLSFAEPEPAAVPPPSDMPPPADPAGEPPSTPPEPVEASDEPAGIFETVHLSAPEPATEPERESEEIAAPAVADASAGDPDLLSLHDYRPGATATPFFGDDDETADWGDLPPLTAPILPPETPTAADEPPPEPEPEADWRIVDETPDEPEAAAFEDTFEAPAEPSDDLDDLISRLEQAPRIRPDPAFNGPAVTVDESSVDEMVSETLAKIYAAQHRYVEAAVMYEKLAAREPGQADEMLRRAAELRDRR